MQSTFEASGRPSAFEHHQLEPIWLRDAKKRLVLYADTRETVLFRRVMAEIDAGVAQINVPEARQRGPFLVVAGEKGDTFMTPRTDNSMVRIFNNNGFAYGGRMFGWHQQIPKPARRTMTINEELIAEADFAAMHISILYSRAGLMLDGDAYDVGDAGEEVPSDTGMPPLDNLLAAGVPVLPVHDAVLMPAQHYDVVEAEMMPPLNVELASPT